MKAGIYIALALTIGAALSACRAAGDDPDGGGSSQVSPTPEQATEIRPGLSMRILRRGSGDRVLAGNIVVAHLTAWVYDAESRDHRGKKLGSLTGDAGSTVRFRLGAGRLQKGIELGLVGMQPGEVRELTIKPELLGDGSPLLMEAELISTRPPAFTLVKAEGEWIDGMAEGSRALRVSIAMMNQSQETFVKIHCVPTISVDFANGHTVDIDGGNMCDHSAVAAISLLFGEPGFAAAAGAATFSAEPDESIEATNDCPPLCFEGPTIGSAYMNYEIQSVFLVVVVDGETPFGKRAKEAVIARFIPPPSERAVFPLMKSADTLVLAQGEEGQKPGTSDIERPRRQNEVEAPAAEAAAREPPQQQELASEIAPREAVSSGELASYAYAIRQQIEQNWIRPASAGPDIECVVNVRQNPDGEVASTTIERCNGDASVRQSIEAAVFAASPLPMPENPALFERNLRITFKPQQ